MDFNRGRIQCQPELLQMPGDLAVVIGLVAHELRLIRDLLAVIAQCLVESGNLVSARRRTLGFRLRSDFGLKLPQEILCPLCSGGGLAHGTVKTAPLPFEALRQQLPLSD